MTQKDIVLTPRQNKGLNKIGDIYCPGDEDFPSFTHSQSVELAPTALENIPTQDRSDLLMLLTVFGFLPKFIVAGIVALIERSLNVPTPIGALLRMMQIGLKGVVMSLYYSGEQKKLALTPIDVIGYKVGVYQSEISACKEVELSTTAPESL